VDEFRACVDGASPNSIFRLMPITDWARKETNGGAHAATEGDDASAILEKLRLPLPVAGFAYPAGCRIRRVRVTARSESTPRTELGPVIVSRRTLEELRG
jgi:hypothetical protein